MGGDECGGMWCAFCPVKAVSTFYAVTALLARSDTQNIPRLPTLKQP